MARETLAGGGRKRVEDADPGFGRALERIMAENTAGDPMSLLRWTNKSTGCLRRGEPVLSVDTKKKERVRPAPMSWA